MSSSTSSSAAAVTTATTATMLDAGALAALTKPTAMKRKRGDDPKKTKKSKKTKKIKKIIKIVDFDLNRDVTFLAAKDNDGFRTAKMFNKHTDGPLLISFNGGGRISSKFGIAASMFGGSTFTFDINDDEHKACAQLHTDLQNMAIANRATWYPGATKSDDYLRENVNATVVGPKPNKKNPEKMYSANFKCGVPDDAQKANASGIRTFNVKTLDGEQVEDLDALMGGKWDKVIVEVSCVFLGAKCSAGFSKRARAVKFSVHRKVEEVDCDSSDDESDEEDEDAAEVAI